MCPEVIRSYTFRATPLAIHATCATKLYVPIRAGYILMTFLQVIFQYVSKSYTFLYVPYHTSRKSRKMYYVPIRADYIPTTFLQVIFKYVSRSYTFLRNCVQNLTKTSKRTLSLSRVSGTRPHWSLVNCHLWG